MGKKSKNILSAFLFGLTVVAAPFQDKSQIIMLPFTFIVTLVASSILRKYLRKRFPFSESNAKTKAPIDENYDVIELPLAPLKETVQLFGRAKKYAPTATRQSDKTQPPHLATLLLCLFLSATDRDNIIGDLDEQFPEQVKRHSVRAAQFFYLIDACTVLYPAVFKLLAKIVETAGIKEIIRRVRFW